VLSFANNLTSSYEIYQYLEFPLMVYKPTAGYLQWTTAFSLWTGMFQDAIPSIPGKTVLLL
jgi:hypothetical protein